MLLTGCTKEAHVSPDSKALLSNPLFAERYAEDMVDRMAAIEIYKEDIIEDEDKKKIIDSTKDEWLDVARKARSNQRDGMLGSLLSIKEEVVGEVLLTKEALHFGPYFKTVAGPSLHVFVTTVVDPRDIEFPDETSIDLGLLKNPIGAQSYKVTGITKLTDYRTVVVWDTSLDRLYGFSQLNVPLNKGN